MDYRVNFSVNPGSVTLLSQTCYLTVPYLSFPIHKLRRWKKKNKSTFRHSDWSRTGVKPFLACGTEGPTWVSIHIDSIWIQGLTWKLGVPCGRGEKSTPKTRKSLGRSYVSPERESFPFSSSEKNPESLKSLGNRIWRWVGKVWFCQLNLSPLSPFVSMYVSGKEGLCSSMRRCSIRLHLLQLHCHAVHSSLSQNNPKGG